MCMKNKNIESQAKFPGSYKKKESVPIGNFIWDIACTTYFKI